MLPPTTRELDACGIGFVADAHGRSSRAIVAAALGGLACVKHRGAVAADARTADGSGLLVPIPPRAVRRGQRGRRAVRAGRRSRARPSRRPRSRRACASSSGASRPSTRARSATWPARRAPRVVHAVFAGPDGQQATDAEAERRALRLRRRIERHDDRHLRGVVLVPHDGLQGPLPRRRPGRLLPRPARRALRRVVRHLPPAVLDQHAVDVGACPAVPHAVPQRRDQRPVGQRAAHAGPGRAGHRRGRPGRRGPVLPGARRATTPTRASSTRPSSCSCGPGATPATSWRWSCPRRGRTSATSTPTVRGFYRYHSALMEPWDGPAGVVFTDGLGRRRPARPQRPAARSATRSARTASSPCAPRWAPSTSAATACVERGRLGPGQMLFVDPTRGFLDDRACKERIAAAGPVRPVGGRRLLPAQPGRGCAGGARRPRRPPGHARPDQGGAGHGAQAHGQGRLRAHVLDGRRLARCPTWRPGPAR